MSTSPLWANAITNPLGQRTNGTAASPAVRLARGLEAQIGRIRTARLRLGTHLPPGTGVGVCFPKRRSEVGHEDARTRAGRSSRRTGTRPQPASSVRGDGG